MNVKPKNYLLDFEIVTMIIWQIALLILEKFYSKICMYFDYNLCSFSKMNNLF